MRPINTATIKLIRRAENNQLNLMESFVDIGSVLPTLQTAESQVLFGRRGTGKTHVLSYLKQSVSESGVCSVMLDMRLIGSTGGIYSDPTLTLAERATRLLSDTLGSIHDQISSSVIEDEGGIYDLSIIGPLLDRFIEASTEVIVEGDVAQEVSSERQESNDRSSSIKFSLAAESSISANTSSSNGESRTQSYRSSVSGSARLRIHFGALARAARNLVDRLPKAELWIILDEWSEVPLDLQPFLADMLRRTLFPIPGVAVKIAAIAQRSNFRLINETSGNIGIEIGADAALGINLDEFLVFDNDAEAAKNFFKELIFRHLRAVGLNDFKENYPTSDRLVNDLFTQSNAFEEFVRSSEGVPRDAINILAMSAQRANAGKISVPDVRVAAKNWYVRGKQQAVTAKSQAMNLLNWIIDEVIQHRQARAFLVPSDLKDELLDFLYDARVLHIIKEGVSAQDIPGKRFNVFTIDYGCYVDLINTNKVPRGLFEVQEEEAEQFVEVPQTDYRSIRRAILNIQEFYDKDE
ncbi:hypothetical protein ACM72I_16535 [Pseudomonas aeruginosa]